MKKETAKLNKIAGQIFGLARMIEGDDNCEKIIVQFQAVKGALDSVFSDVLQANLQKCLKKKGSKELNSILKQIIKR
jgi:DNA-binding FrmR family transcriptional regulator